MAIFYHRIRVLVNMFDSFLFHTVEGKQLQKRHLGEYAQEHIRSISGKHILDLEISERLLGETSQHFAHSAVCTILKAMHVKLFLANAFPVEPENIGYRFWGFLSLLRF